MNQTWDVIIVGAGAAGLMAAITAANKGAQVLVLDGATKIGAKILVSGGNRCNVTNDIIHPNRFHTESDPFGPQALKGDGQKSFVGRVLRAFNQKATLQFFENIGVELKLEPTGKYFPVSNSSRTVLNALIQTLRDSGANLKTGARVVKIERRDDLWHLHTDVQSADKHAASTCREVFTARALVLCSGGKALPKTGSDGAGYQFALQFGHTLIPTTPALTPLLTQPTPHRHLSGVALPVQLELRDGNHILASREGSFLFTHAGYSGPVALNLSRHVARQRAQFPAARVVARWIEDVEPADEGRWWQEWVRNNAKRTFPNALRASFGERFPERVAQMLGEPFGNLALGRFSPSQQKAARERLFAHQLPVHEVDNYIKAEATAGGIALNEIEPHTMMSQLQPGLFLAGEICDVDGWLGGYNFQWAWSSGVVAGRASAKWAAMMQRVLCKYLQRRFRETRT